MDKNIILSGIKPTGIPTLGNYIGALRNWNLMQQDGNYCYYMVADLHALTVRNDPDELRSQTRSMAALLIACGIDPERSPLFIQSHVHQHAELSWVLGCTTYMGELNRMTQFKDKAAKHADNINAGLFTYPVLMAADILVYGANQVPVGDDQKQHVELARNIAIRFNNAFGETFVVPEPVMPKFGARIMGLQDPEHKMSKTDTNPNSYISMLDEPAAITKKFKKAVTDCEPTIAYAEGRHGCNNLLTIYCACTGKTMDEAVKDFEGCGYGRLKTCVADAVIAELEPVQNEYRRILSDREYLDGVLKKGADTASERAQKTLDLVFERVGIR
ncbi:MAG: tryptophan--tRNA ligase [Clostridiales bacterium]|nr:tryptophan--tRNA ligase [Clostridiales bacterium]